MNDQDLLNIEIIRPHLTDRFGDPTNEQCISYALDKAARDLEGQPLPRHPRKKW
jgi:hypothetical protein